MTVEGYAHPGHTPDQRAAFAALVRPLLTADRARHTVALSVLHQLEADDPHADPVLLSVHSGPRLVGAAPRTPPYPLISSALATEAAGAVLGVLAEADPELPGFTGPAEVVDALVAAAGRAVVEHTELRLFGLGTLVEPHGVPGAPRRLQAADVALVAERVRSFNTEAGTETPGRTEDELVAGWVDSRTGAWLWEHDGQVVSLAKAGPPSEGVSRIGPVHAPAEHRGHGYAAAVTARAGRPGRTRWCCSPTWPTRWPTGCTRGWGSSRWPSTVRCAWLRTVPRDRSRANDPARLMTPARVINRMSGWRFWGALRCDVLLITGG